MNNYLINLYHQLNELLITNYYIYRLLRYIGGSTNERES